MDNVLYRASWQKLRVSMLREYNEYSGFLTPDGALDGINRFNNYIEDANPSSVAPYVKEECARMASLFSTEYSTRVFRVWNYMHATINGLTSLNLPHRVTMQQYYDELENKLNQTAVVAMSDHWNWDVVKEEMTTMWIVERVWFTRIYDDFYQRIVEKDQTAPDMLKFKSIMDEINTI